MISDKLPSWRKGVAELNENSQNLISQRDACYRWIANEIKDIFNESGNPIPNVHINNRGDRITCKWAGDESLKISPDAISKLQMNFDFTRKYDDDGQVKKMMTLYPFED